MRSTYRYFAIIWLVAPIALSATLAAEVYGAEENTTAAALINFREPASIAAHRPIIVAHRGGVISDRSPECSLTAIRMAAEQGYDMVELDVQMSKDKLPIVFHDRTLEKACGKSGSVAEYTASELESIGYLRSDDRITLADGALQICKRLNLGVMLDLKAGADSSDFLLELRRLLAKHQLINATISISGSETARRTLTGVRFTPTTEQLRRLRAGDPTDLSDRFWFGLPQRLQPGDVAKLKKAGALIIPAINTFRYPADKHLVLAKQDVRRLSLQGVDGFQIDSVYFALFGDDATGE